MNLTFEKVREGEANEHNIKFNGTATSGFTLFSNTDENEWTLLSPDGEWIKLEADNLDAAKEESVKEVGAWLR